MLRAIEPIPLVGPMMRDIPSSPPRFDLADSKTRSSRTITSGGLRSGRSQSFRKIAENFDWLHIKPAVCARGTNYELCVIDGQHTAIVTASRGVAKIPVMIVEAPEIARRARAFVAHSTTD